MVTHISTPQQALAVWPHVAVRFPDWVPSGTDVHVRLAPGIAPGPATPGRRESAEGTYRVYVRGVPLRFFLRDTDVWSPVTDIEFHHAYEVSMFDLAALGRNVLCPNRRRVELETAEGWLWTDGHARSGLMTYGDRWPQQCAGLAHISDEAPVS